jgi:hypothetical protein
MTGDENETVNLEFARAIRMNCVGKAAKPMAASFVQEMPMASVELS